MTWGGGEDHRFLILRKKKIAIYKNYIARRIRGTTHQQELENSTVQFCNIPKSAFFCSEYHANFSQELPVVSREWDRLSALRKKRRPMTPWRVPMTFSGGEEGGPF